MHTGKATPLANLRKRLLSTACPAPPRRWLKECKDGLYRPAPMYFEEQPGSLVAVRTQFLGGKAAPGGGDAYKLLTLRSRILDTELLE